MSLWNRMASLAKADAHGVVDSLEEPSLVLRQQLREAEGELQRKQGLIDATRAEIDALTKEDERLAERGQELDQDIEMALDSDKDELARFAIKRLVPMRRRRSDIAARLRSLEDESGALEETLNRQKIELEGLEQRVRSRLTHLQRDDDTSRVWQDTIVTDEEVELELLRRRPLERQGQS